jgi:phosphate transport system protein
MDSNIITPHISRRYNQDLENIFNKVLAMGGHVEEQMTRAFEALRKSDAVMAREVIGLDRFINRQEANIDEMCVRLLARQQPAAIDLRLIMAALHIVTDLERVGDEITKLSRVVINLRDSENVDCASIPGYEHLVEMTVCAQEMLKITLDAFANLDVKKALTLLPKEAAADEEYRAAQKLMREHMMAHPEQIPSMLDLLNALRAMERVTDHSLNIAEHVFYVVEGSDMRQISSERLADIANKYREIL